MKISRFINILAIILMSIIFLPSFHMNFSTKSLIGFNLLTLTNVMSCLAALIAIKQPSVYISKPMILVYIYFAVFTVYKLSGNFDNNNIWFWEYQSPVLVATIIFTYYILSKDYKGFAMVIATALVCIAISSTLNVIQLIRYPDAVRSQYIGSQGEVFRQLSLWYQKIGVAGYGFISGTSFLFPVIIGVFRNSTKGATKIGFIMLIAVMAISVFLASITGPILIAGMGLIIAFIGRKRLRASISILSFIILLILIIPKVYIAQVFYYAADLVENQSVAMKFNDIGISIEEGVDVDTPTNSMEYRAERIPRNLERFANSPIWGNSPLKPGDEQTYHIFWLYYFAQFGIVGALPLLLVILSNIRINLRVIDEKFEFYYLVSVALFFFLGFIKGYVGVMMYYILLVAPGAYYLNYIFSGKELHDKQHQVASRVKIKSSIVASVTKAARVHSD